jgi:hypothetical protein
MTDIGETRLGVDQGEGCPNCRGGWWVCENHPDKPWTDDGCECGAGMPCPECNPYDRDNPPRKAPGTTVLWDAKNGWRH